MWEHSENSFDLQADQVSGLPAFEVVQLRELLKVFRRHSTKNDQKNKYYEGNVSLNEVNLGIALPEGIRKLEIGCAWGAKCVDVLAARSMFDGFVGQSGEDVEDLEQIVAGNQLIAEYGKACRDELKYGCTFATLSSDSALGCKIRFHSPQTSAALWDGDKGRISCGFVIVDGATSNEGKWQPTIVNLYTDTAIWVLRRENNLWRAERRPHRLGRPLMEPLIWNATSNKPFGRSRIKEPIRRLIQGYVRTVANATIGLEFATAPQKYLLGVTDEQYDAVVNQKFKQSVGSSLASTVNPETGEKPSFGQLTQGSIAPHVEMLRTLATQFSAATGLTSTDVGVINDANPSSSDAILAQSQTLILMAEQLNTGNGDSLHAVAIMAQAIANNVRPEELTEEQRDVVAHFKNPAMPSVATTADAAIKLATSRPEFAGTDVFLEMNGFDPAEIRRIKAQEGKARGQKVLEMEFNDADTAENVD